MFRAAVRMVVWCAVIAAVSGLLMATAAAQNTTAGVVDIGGMTVQGTPIVDTQNNAAWRMDVASSMSGNVKREVVAVDGQPFASAVRVQTLQDAPQPQSVQLYVVNTQPVTNGQVLFARFYARGRKLDQPGEQAEATFIFETHGPPWDKSVVHQFFIGEDWQEITIPFMALESYVPGRAKATFRLGFSPQEVEIADFELLRMPFGVSLRDLPRTAQGYRGREPDAGWRMEAQQRIEELRKADLVVSVVDANGQPIEDAAVRVDLERHAFGFGTAIHIAAFNHSAYSDRYREIIERLFNRVTFEVSMKWPYWERDFARQARVFEALDWLEERKIEVRGHALVWPGWRYVPADLRALESDLEALRARIDERVTSMTTQLKGRIRDWDVINEPLLVHEILDIFGWEEMVRWLKLAHEADPEARLFVNIASVPNSWPSAPVYDELEKLIEFLLDHDAPLHGIGMQGHFASPQSPYDLLKTLDRFGKYGLPIHITEFDFATSDDELQADYLRDVLTVAFSHPAVENITIWGFWEPYHWRQNAELWRQDWSIRPAGDELIRLLTEEWWTREETTTDTNGEARINGFLGDYTIEVEYEGRVITQHAVLTKEGTVVEVRLD